MAIGEPKIDLTLSKGEESLSYADLMEQLHAMVKAKNGKPLSPDEIRIIKEKLEAYNPVKRREFGSPWEMQFELAREIMGHDNVYGPEDNAFCSSKFDEYLFLEERSGIPEIPFNVGELKRAKELNMSLVYIPRYMVVAGKLTESPKLYDMCRFLLDRKVTMRMQSTSLNAGNFPDILRLNIPDTKSLSPGWMLISNNIVEGSSLTEDDFFLRAKAIQNFASHLNLLQPSMTSAKKIWEKYGVTIEELLYFIMVRGPEHFHKPGSDIGFFRAFDVRRRDHVGVGVVNDEIVLCQDGLRPTMSAFGTAGILFKWKPDPSI